MEDWKIKISALWLFYVVAMLIVFNMVFFAPGMIDEIRAGKALGAPITGEFLLSTTIIMLVPLLMFILSLTLKDRTDRWANIILGIVFTFFSIANLIEVLALDFTIFAYAILMDILMIAATVLIVWYAWKSKQRV